jgi:hypothetical protein
MTQSSTSRNTRTSGLRRPALALAFGTAAAASVLAPVASMAVTPLPINNDSLQTAAQANVEITAQVKAAIDAAPAVKPYATKYNAAVLAEGKAHAAYTAAVKSKNKAKIATAAKLWNPKKTGTTQKTLLTATANYKGSKGAYTKYSTAHGAALKATITGQHFKLTSGTFSGFGSSAGHQCSTADNMTSGALYAAERAAGVSSPFIGQSAGDQSTLATPGDSTSGLVIRCNTDQASPNFGRLEYYLIGGSGDHVAAWEYFSAAVTVAGGKVTGIPVTDTNATLDSLTTYTHEYMTNHVTLVDLATIPAAKRPDFNTYALNVLNKSGDFDPTFSYKATTGKTCISANSGATLTCISFQKSLQKALTFAVKGMPY